MKSSKGTAIWHGSGKEGSGHISSQSGALSQAKYSWSSRFADGKGTNPEELIASAHAGCYTMKLSFILGEAGFTPDALETTSTVTIDAGTITGSHLVVKAKVPGITHEKLEECGIKAKETCPVSKALSIDISLEIALTEETLA